MSERLPGNLQERLRELREEHGYSSRNKLADVLGIDRTTYSRIENGTTKTINSDVLVKLAELYDVSTDYILGLSDTPEKTYYDIGELGLSVEAAKNIYSGKVSKNSLNELLLNNKFAVATHMMEDYFCGALAELLVTQNAMMDNSYNLLTYLIEAGEIPNDIDMKNLKKTLKHAKISPNQAEIDRIQRQLTSAIKEIRKKVVNEIKEANDYLGQSEVANYDVLKAIQEEAKKIPTLKGLPEEKKNQFVIDMIKNGIRENKTISEEDLQKIDQLIKQVAPMLNDLWKNQTKI